MNITGNITLFAGSQENRITADNPETKKKQEQLEKGSVFSGDLNENLFMDKIEARKKAAQKRALQVVSDAWEGDRKIDEDLQERRDLINRLQEENRKAQAGVNEINQMQEAVKQQYGIADDSQEQKDLELLLREQEMFKDPSLKNPMSSSEGLTKEELEYVAGLKARGLTDYQQKQLELEASKGYFQKDINENLKIIREETRIIRGIKLERLKSDPMVKAQKEADSILNAASREIIGMLVEESKEHMDEVSEEKEEQAEKLEEKQEQMEELIEARKEKNEEMEELLEELPVEEMVSIDQLKDEIKQQVEKIASEMKLVVEDIKGAVVDENR